MQSLLSDTLHLPATARLSERVLSLDKAASEKDLIGLVHRLVSVAACSHWALATVLFELLQRKGEPWLNDLCTAAHIHPKLRRELLAVHTFYPTPKRTYDLTYGHYRDAMLIVNDGQPHALYRACTHLETAHNNGWSVADLRRHARTNEASKPTPSHEDGQTDNGLGGYQAVHDMARYAHRELPSIASWTPDRARLVLTDLGETAEFIDRLRAIACLGDSGVANFNDRGTPGVKESFLQR